MGSRASFFSRLALALLAITGVVVPSAQLTPRDELVIESSLDVRAPRPVVEAAHELACFRAPGEAPLEPSALVEAVPVARRRFLLNRAWLN